MDSREKRPGFMSENNERERHAPYSHNRESGSYQGRRPTYRPKQDYKKDERRKKPLDESEEEEKEFVPLKRQNKALTLVMDGADLTLEDIAKEFEKYQIKLEQPESAQKPQETEKASEASGVIEAEKAEEISRADETTGEAEKAEEKSDEAEKVEEILAELEVEVVDVEEVPAEEARAEEVPVAETAGEQERPAAKSANRKEAQEKAPREKTHKEGRKEKEIKDRKEKEEQKKAPLVPTEVAPPVQVVRPVIDISKYGIVGGVPTKNTAENNTWDTLPADALLSAVFNTQPAAAPKPQKKLLKPKTRPDSKKVEEKAEVADRVGDKVGDKLADKVEMKVADKVADKVGDKMAEKDTDKVEMKVAEETRGTKNANDVKDNDVKEEVRTEGAGSIGEPEGSQNRMAPASAVTTAVRSTPSTPPTTIVYTKEQLLSYKGNSKNIKVTINKSLFSKTTASFSKKKREFKSFKTGTPQDKRLTATVFSAIEDYIAEFNLALNQVSYTNIEEVEERLLKIQVPTNEAMVGLTKMFFERAMQQEAYADIYAKLVNDIQKNFRSKEEEPYDEKKYMKEKEEDKKNWSSRSVFGKAMANLARAEFFEDKKWVEEETEQKTLVMSSDQVAARVLEISNNKEKEYARMLVKKRALTCVRYIGNLFLFGFFTSRIIHVAIKNILPNPSAENVERLCYLLRWTGIRLEIEEELVQGYIDGYFMWLDEAVKPLSARFKFMVEDLKELRAAKWRPENIKKPEDENEDEWKSCKSKEKKKWSIKEKTEKEKPLLAKKDQKDKVLKISEQIEKYPKDYQKMESIAASVIKSTERPEDEVKRLLEHKNSPVFLTAFIKITIESYGDSLSRGKSFISEWVKHSPISVQRKEEIFTYIENTMEDILDDSPEAPKHLTQIKAIVNSQK